MPRQGSKRKKTRTEKESGEITEKELKQVPRCFVLKRGHVGDRIKDLVKDFREVMMPNCAKSLKEKKSNRIEDFVAVSSHYGVSHLVLFTATKAATYMKLARLPQGPTLTFKVDSFTLSREVRAAQKRPQGSSRDYITAPLQVLNGFGGPKDAPEGAGGGKSMKVAERQLAAEMLRGFFPAIDVPTFSQAECRRAALFHYDRESDAILFRHFVVGRKQMGIERGVSRLTKFNRLPNLAKRGDIADYVLGGGGAASESEIEEAAEVPSVSGGRVSVRLSESGPRMKLLLMKAEEGVCTGGVFYHRFQTKTPSQQEVLQERARQRQKLRERNARLDSKEHAVKKKAKERRKEQHRLNDRSDDEEEAAVQPNPGESDSEDGKGGQQAGKKKRFNPFNFRKKGPSSKAAGASDQSGQSKGAGKGKGKGKGKKIGTQ
eukprot:CAMPEP_0197632826 /NCGR_PEP_ID=MMETSP1338-20131121/9387_1 /TAXON_ID=43686 ORGANISM="Pelagodinium beii, Strain RCC1491" /NCGR_SAMPLE_ID=MMETSP1338 /ASSEMBLY_ACC=CAM_ASM_000754 /LENGTH=431 /DNA_ID=CAMNT_0043204397 /DNA_START=39 /DNA_END=1331 /DNA_ORIENTATION=-